MNCLLLDALPRWCVQGNSYCNEKKVEKKFSVVGTVALCLNSLVHCLDIANMLAWVSVLLLAGAIHSQGHSRSRIFATVQESSVLRSINLRDYESAVELRRRTEEDFSELNPSSQS